MLLNQPNFCPSTTWNPAGVTFANASTSGWTPSGMFIDSNNTVYVIDANRNLVQIWFEGNRNPSLTLRGNFNMSLSLFVTHSGDIYIDNGLNNSRVEKLLKGTNSSISVMTVNTACFGLFVDRSDSLYCSLSYDHRVVKKWLSDNSTTPTTVAGTGSCGSAANRLSYPNGLFVDVDFNLYVADWGNDRIQMFRLGQMSAITVAGNGAPGTISLNKPFGIIFDANGYLFISDSFNHRIVGSGPFGFRCLFGCDAISGSGPQQFNEPRRIAFDTYGNLFVADRRNNRIQKFLIVSNSCSEYLSI